MAKLGSRNSETPEPMVTKFGMGGYVGDMTPHTIIQTDRPSGGVETRQISKITLAWFLFFVTPKNFVRVPRLNRKTNFYAVWFIECQSILGYCIPRGRDKTTKSFRFSHFYPGVNKHFEAQRSKYWNLQIIETTAPIQRRVLYICVKF